MTVLKLNLVHLKFVKNIWLPLLMITIVLLQQHYNLDVIWLNFTDNFVFPFLFLQNDSPEMKSCAFQMCEKYLTVVPYALLMITKFLLQHHNLDVIWLYFTDNFSALFLFLQVNSKKRVLGIHIPLE